MRVLFVEDSPRLQRSVTGGLRRAGYAVDGAIDGEDAFWRAQESDYDVIVLDLMLPRMDGLTVLRKLRGAGVRSHVLVLTAKDTVADRVRGLRAGADDYLVKPFAFDELLARIEALTRRRYGETSSRIVLGEVEIDRAARRVSLSGRPIRLTRREYTVLEFLALRRGEVVTRAEIEEHVYDDRQELASNVVDVIVCALRRKLGEAGTSPSPLIRTRRGMGYQLEAPPS